jgi:beta-N-acetylhexosaminidase
VSRRPRASRPRRRPSVATLLLAAVAVAAPLACARLDAAQAPVATAPVAATPALTLADSAWVERTLAALPLRARVAQLVWPSILGDYQQSDDPRWLTALRQVRAEGVGGFTISVGSPLDFAAKVDALQAAASVPLLFAADFESGAGMRARGGVFLPNGIELGGATWTPPLMAIGAANDTALAHALGRITALEGRALGTHIVYGPVLDVNNNPANPVINVRSFGEDPQRVAALGAAFVRGVQDHGMLATGKHFPGHGDTDVNSHLALPTVSATRARLDSVELVPFRAAIAAGVGAMMTFHGAMPNVDASGVPATLSPAIIGRLLRDTLGFQGLAITDAMDMRGVLEQFGAREAAVRAVLAGADVLIQPEDVTVTIDAIVAAVEAGRIPPARIDEAARRVLTAKARLGLTSAPRTDAMQLRALVGAPAHLALADSIAARGLTLVRDAGTRVPVARGPRTLLSVTVARRSDLLAGQAFDAQLRAAGHRVRSLFIDADAPSASAFAAALAAADSVDAVLIGSYVAQRWDATSIAQSRDFVDFATKASRTRAGAIVVAFGNPYLLQQLPEVGSYLVAWSGTSATQRAAARALTGAAPITGRLPIRIPPHAALGDGLQRAVRSP